MTQRKNAANNVPVTLGIGGKQVGKVVEYVWIGEHVEAIIEINDPEMTDLILQPKQLSVSISVGNR
jgi:hypothetical protein